MWYNTYIQRAVLTNVSPVVSSAVFFFFFKKKIFLFFLIILKKLDITQEELKNIMSASRKTAENYKNQNGYEKILRKIKKIIKYNQG